MYNQDDLDDTLLSEEELKVMVYHHLITDYCNRNPHYPFCLFKLKYDNPLRNRKGFELHNIYEDCGKHDKICHRYLWLYMEWYDVLDKLEKRIIKYETNKLLFSKRCRKHKREEINKLKYKCISLERELDKILHKVNIIRNQIQNYINTQFLFEPISKIYKWNIAISELIDNNTDEILDISYDEERFNKSNNDEIRYFNKF